MNTSEFDYDAFFGDLESVSTLSTTSPTPTTSTETDLDSGVGNTPPRTMGLDNTVIDLDEFGIFPSNMDSPLSDDPNDYFKNFSSWLTEATDNNSTFDTLFSSPDPSVQHNPETSQILPTEYKSIINTPSVNPTYFKVGSTNPNQNITIIRAIKPVTVAQVPVITLAKDSIVKTVNIVPTPSVKRRRSNSPTSPEALPTLTLDQLKLQYGNMSDEGLKKHLRMIKNRESASLSRKRRKELMENLDVTVKQLTDENDELKKQNSKLLTRIHTLEIENTLLREIKQPGNTLSQPRKPLILMGIALLVVFNVFTLKSLAPISNDPSGSIALYNTEGAVVPSRAILSDRRSSNENLAIASNEHDYGPDGNYDPSMTPNYPYIQCVAYINKTHSKRINQDLRSWVEDRSEKQSVIIPDQNSLTIPSNSVIRTASIEPLQHVSRKVARQSKGQLQPYKTHEADYDDFIHTIDRRNDTLYFVSFKRDHLILPAREQNQTTRPKMSLILPASMANLNKSIHVPTNHVPMIKIDCEVEDTKLVFVKHNHIPSSYRNELFEYYSSLPQASI